MPRATYRLQLTPSFTLHDAAAAVPYLAALGVSHVFCSPVLQATVGSTHGYDVVDHAAVNSELGGDAGLDELHFAADRHGLELMIDIVPNHMAVGSRTNRQWWDVLRLGVESQFAQWFDIDWDAGNGKVLVPILGSDLDSELAAGSLRIVDGPDGPELAYYDHRLPLAPSSFDPDGPRADEGVAAPAAVIDAQHYRLADWHASAQQLNYRRFFDIDTLAGLRVEDDAVFDATHARILEWVSDGTVDALRLDHPDGLRNPAAYFRHLREATAGCWTVVEKILEPGEELPTSWACDGTTGYDHMAMAGGLFIDVAAKQELEAGFAAFTGERRSYDEIVAASKADVLADVLAADVNRITVHAAALCSDTGTGTNTTGATDGVRRAVVALATHFDVYRTYVVDPPASASDVAVIERAAAAARREPDVPPEVLDVLVTALLADSAEATTASSAEFRARFQQFTGPVMAKSVEDTTFYRYVPIVSLNEVGSHPGHFGVTVDTYHDHAMGIAEQWPRALNASTTHDTKRSEDVRARISLLSEMPRKWNEVIEQWQAINAGAWHGTTPDPTIELLLYQVMVGAYPLPADRAVAYMEKASREAKQRTSWLAPDIAYDDALARFTAEVAEHQPFLDALGEFCDPLLVPGRMASLAMLILKVTAPGAADIYQGCETWTDSLVDPDNRRPVDYAARRDLLAKVTTTPGPPTIDLANDHAAATKMWLTHALLALRARHAESFEGPHATYEPLSATGSAADAVVAARRGGDIVSVVGVRPLRLHAAGWGDTELPLPPGRWVDIVEGHFAEGAARLADHASRYGATVFERQT